MKIVKQYVCEVCKTAYADKPQAEACESSHKQTLIIKSARYLPVTVDASGLPVTITVEYKDGRSTKTAVYKR